MAGDELDVVRLKNDFYRDGINKIFIALSAIIAIIAMLLIVSFYLHAEKPHPVVFATDNDGRSYAPIPIDTPFLKDADLLQWLNDAITKSFNFDFINYKDQLNALKIFYTDNGYAKLQTILNTYASAAQVQNTKLFVSAGASGTPVIYNQGLVAGRYTWILHMPINVSYSSGEKNSLVNLPLEITVVRTQVNNELAGIAIDDIIVTKPAETATQG